MSYAYGTLDPFTAPMYGGLATPRYRRLIEHWRADLPQVAIGARRGGEPVGLAVAGCFPDAQSAWLHWVFVAAPHRRRGVGAALLRQLEDGIGARDCRRVTALYHSGLPFASGLESLFGRCGWDTPRTVQIIYEIGPAVLDAPWMQRRWLRDGFSIFPWVEVTAEEREAIAQRQAAGGWYDEGVDPFMRPPERLEPHLSLGVRHRGQVVGWILSTQIAPQITSVEILFVSPEVRMSGAPLALIAEHTRRQVVDLGIQKTMFNCDVDNAPMIQLMDRLMTPPALVGRHEKRRVEKEVTPAMQ